MSKFKGKKLFKVVYFTVWDVKANDFHIDACPTLNDAFRKAYSLLLHKTSGFSWKVNLVEIWYGEFTHPELCPLEKLLVLKRKV